MPSVEEVTSVVTQHQDFGLDVPATARTHWGARAILTDEGFSLLPDRQCFTSDLPVGSTGRTAFGNLSNRCIERLRGVEGGSDEWLLLHQPGRWGVLSIQTKADAGAYFFRATSHGSESGYLYLCAWIGEEGDGEAWDAWFTSYFGGGRRDYTFLPVALDGAEGGTR